MIIELKKINGKMFLLILFIQTLTYMQAQDNNKFNKLTIKEIAVIENKGTELPFTGKYNLHQEEGKYICKKCNAPLYEAADKFNSSCGWPSFDDEIEGAIRREVDADGRRTEILCANCGAHLGHVFEGEHYTDKNIRHCVNSISLNFVPKVELEKIEVDKIAIFAGGCFWGMEYYFQKVKGVKSVEVGYIGGHIDYPSYQDVCSHNSGHFEAIKVVFDPREISYEELAKLFFEIHDPTQVDGQGPDIGPQYKSAIFYESEQQKEIAQKLIRLLENKGLKVVTELLETETFWIAEEYHQNYYENKGGNPYCHFRVKRFD